MKILVTGGTGQVGWELRRTLQALGEVVSVSREQADLSDLDALRRTLQTIKPDIVVNPAAYTAVDKAETDQEQAFLVNAKAPGVLAEEVKKLGGLLIHYSTDYVFDGSNSVAYTETDATNPLNVYGKSKLAGEQAIQAIGCQHLLIRTSWVYAARGQNFLKTILRLAAEREELNIVADQIGSPTWARLIAEVTAHMLRQSVLEIRQDDFHSDVYNLTSAGSTSWHGFAQAIVNVAHKQGKLQHKNPNIKPIPATAYPVPAPRPANSRLSVSKLETHFNLLMPSWRDALQMCMEEIA
ncbi:MAG: dTDP-4-dehydrorhamnose reductase [Methylococcales bacterium]